MKWQEKRKTRTIQLIIIVEISVSFRVWNLEMKMVLLTKFYISLYFLCLELEAYSNKNSFEFVDKKYKMNKKW